MSALTPIQAVRSLVAYGLRTELIEKDDAVFTANMLFDVLGIEPDSEFTPFGGEDLPLEDILAALLDDAVARGHIEDGIASRDLFDTKLMGCLTPRPSEVVRTFKALYQESPKQATDYFYKVSRDSDYIRTYRIKKDAAALTKKQNAYPRCLLCPENVGYAGRLDHPARQTIRLIPLTLDGEDWFMQYSPYVYYNEHCIVLSGEHIPMKIDIHTFKRLLEFVTLFPHYTVGSNADLPIVGGSILTHEHFQGGNYTFAMAKAKVRESIAFDGFEDIKAGIVDWPMSVIRLDGKDPERIAALAGKILDVWRGYSDSSCGIFAETEGTPHNTITPIARMNGSDFELDLVLRNNLTTEEHPLGVFHPHAELHHIKKENIGLIEVMGLAVLPARLLQEMEALRKAVLEGKEIAEIESLASHAAWVSEILEKYPEFAPENVKNTPEADKALEKIIEDEIGFVFAKVLEHCGVYKETEEGKAGFDKFIVTVNAQ